MVYNVQVVHVDVYLLFCKFGCLLHNVLDYWPVKFFNVKLNKIAVTFVYDVIELF